MKTFNSAKNHNETENLDGGITASPYLSTSEAAEVIRHSPATLTTWRCRRSDGPPFLKIGPRKVLYPRAELIAWAAAHGLQTHTASRPAEG
ncbi:MAG: Helix-turn-helix domain [Candidatus Sumerlaeota bacterium]|nr:Helix-turn-helix domain [Candidatus Sumerlaeota bacterium]